MILPDIELEPVLIPHHKGRKRLHLGMDDKLFIFFFCLDQIQMNNTKIFFYILLYLELKESLSRMGSDLKQGFISSLKTAWQTLHDFARAHTASTKLHEQLAIVASQIKEEEEMQKEEGRL